MVFIGPTLTTKCRPDTGISREGSTLDEKIVIVASLVIGYVCGSFLTAEVVSRHVGGKSAFDVGLGNPGMANVGSVYGVKAAAATLAGDLVKVIIAFVVARALFPTSVDLAGICAATATTVGHVFPAWHGFRGGKGVATSCAAIVLTAPVMGIASLVIGLLTVLLGGYLCVGAIVIPSVWLVMQLIWGDMPHVIAGVVLVAIAVFCHGGPARGIATGETGRASISTRFWKAVHSHGERPAK
jgi:glycerol-3-phosphate acyltransferase PlsY